MQLRPIIQSRLSQFAHGRRWIAQTISRPEMAIIGGYHCGNVGDMALGETIKFHAQTAGIQADLQTIYNLSRWPVTSHGIVGGGAVAYGGPLRELQARFGKTPQRLAILGVDFNDLDAVETNASFLSQVAMITCRSSEQAQRLSGLLGRPDIAAQPDLTLASRWARDAAARPRSTSDAWGMSCPPLIFRHDGKRFIPDSPFIDELSTELPDIRQRLPHYAEQYVSLLRGACQRIRDLGKQVFHLPFTAADDAFAREILEGFDVTYLPFTSSPASVYRQMKRFECFVTGRFHSLAFALQSRTPCLPFCYASKSSRLLQDLGLSPERFVTFALLADSDPASRLWSLSQHPLVLPKTQLANAYTQASTWIEAGLSAIGLNSNVAS